MMALVQLNGRAQAGASDAVPALLGTDTRTGELDEFWPSRRAQVFDEFCR